MKLTKKQLQRIIKEEQSLIERFGEPIGKAHPTVGIPDERGDVCGVCGGPAMPGGVCEICEGEDDEMDEVAPPGWEGTVKAMKKHKRINNPWALSWSMKNKGYKSHKKEGVMHGMDDMDEGFFDDEEPAEDPDNDKKEPGFFNEHDVLGDEDDPRNDPTQRCEYWDELEFMAADREFDGGEFSGPAQDERGMENEPCGMCPACIKDEEENEGSDYSYPPEMDEV